GELKKARSTIDPNLVYTLDHWELKPGDKCEKGSQLRPHIVWFGEPVPLIEKAAEIAKSADLFMVVGTSMVVYPAAGLVHYVSREAPKFYVDPKAFMLHGLAHLEIYRKKAGEALPLLVDRLLRDFS
ncbi:MAG TPA: NAD-dependent deacylase, partial [Bacteroidetes bacterium]|nr:NAD-dependent deacylase [Bacteroidota bacterium]